MIKVICSRCHKELEEQGALIFGLPFGDLVHKYHICRECWEELRKEIEE